MAGEEKKIAYLKDFEGEQGNVAVFGPNNSVVDGHKSLNSLVDVSQVTDLVNNKVAEAAEDIWDAVNGAYAIAAYNSAAWTPDTSFAKGDFCKHGGSGYVCLEAHESGNDFDNSKWKEVLTPGGIQAIESLLSAYSKDGLAALTDLAPAYVHGATYKVNQLVKKDGVLQMCTQASPATFAPATVEQSIAARIAALADSIPEKVSELQNDEGFVTGDAIDYEYDTSEHGYAVGDTCSYEGKFYICISAVSQDDDFDPEDWRESTLKEIAGTWWADDSRLPYRIANILPGISQDPTVEVFQLFDRAVNIITLNNSEGKSLSLYPPASQGNDKSRDFYVVLKVASPRDVPVSLYGASLTDYVMGSPSLMAPKDSYVVYKFTEISASGSQFMVSCAADPAWMAIKEIERALDDLLVDGGSAGTLGVYIPDDQGKFHKLTAVRDDETGEYNIGIEQEGESK